MWLNLWPNSLKNKFLRVKAAAAFSTS